MSRLSLVLPLLGLLAASADLAPAEEGLAGCRGRGGETPVVLTHLGGCATAPDLRTLHAIGNGGGGWSIALVSRVNLSRLRESGCPSAVLCPDGNSYVALTRRLPAARLRRRIDGMKASARPPLRPGVDGGPVLHPD